MPLWMQIVIGMWMFLVLYAVTVTMINTSRTIEWLIAILTKR